MESDFGLMVKGAGMGYFFAMQFCNAKRTQTKPKVAHSGLFANGLRKMKTLFFEERVNMAQLEFDRVSRW